jgi:hypothetical protein
VDLADERRAGGADGGATELQAAPRRRTAKRAGSLDPVIGVDPLL